MDRIYDLKCNAMTNPAGLDQYPVFSWKLESDTPGDEQAAWQITVRAQDGSCVWDSGRQMGSATSGILYAGEELLSHAGYNWQVCVELKEQTLTSETATFSMGMLNGKWTAKWIEAGQVRKPLDDCTEMWKMFAGIVTSKPNPEESLNPAVCMRREVNIQKEVSRALIYATARGIYQLKLDGQTISELLAPGYTVYSKYLEMQQYDVTARMTEGNHAIAVTLADGWFTGKVGLPGVGNQYGETNAFYMQMEIFYADGSRQTIESDETFRWTESPLEYADLIVGERYRQGFLDSAWEQAGYDDSFWRPVLVKDYGTSGFRGRRAEPVRVIRCFQPEKILRTPKGELVIDAGENIAGVLNIRFLGEADTLLRMTHSEVLDKDGNFQMNIMGQNKNQMDVYVCAKAGEVQWQLEFTMHGFRYVKLEGIGEDQLLDVQVLVLSTDMERTGAFRCSDERLNQLQENIFRSQQGNMISIPTDCPQRERAGWTGDMQVYAPTACYNMDVYAFLDKWLENMRLEQLPDGQIPNIIPTMPSDALVGNSTSKHICSAAWGDACIIIPYILYRKYGNKKILTDNLSMIRGWMQYVERQASTSFLKPAEEYTAEELERQKYLWNTEFHFGEWLYPSASAEGGMGDPIQTALQTKEYVAPTMFAYTSDLMSRICGALEMKDEEQHYRELNQNIRKAYAEEYIDDEGRLPVQLQGVYVLALAMNLYPEETRQKGIDILISLIHANGDHLDTGFSSVGFLLDTLWENGEQELAYKLLFADTCPSWLYEVKMGATTIWESWNAILPDGTTTNSSYNHFAYGCVGDFIYRRILGLHETEPGYRNVQVAPAFDCGLLWAEGSYECPYGKIRVYWEKSKDGCEVQVTLPPGVTGVLEIGSQQQTLSSGENSYKV
ncbi:MAG: glycoside hydrolase family 78 protein [Clostridiales bacterium]|nr:glycoside hydrolase family 78 protein [Clostridiales bacterium]